MGADNAEVPLATPMAELDAKFLVEFGETLAIVDSRRTKNGKRRHLTIHLSGGERHKMLDVPARRSVGETAAAIAGLRPTRIVRLPPGRVVAPKPTEKRAAGWLPLLPGLVIMVFALAADLPPVATFLILLVGAAAVVGGYLLGARRRESLDWVFVRGQQRIPLEGLRPPARPEDAVDPDIDALKAEYGRLLTDIVHRIEYPALFDPHEPHTQEFTVALLEWDNTQDELDPEPRAKLGRRVIGAFAAARANAERVGLDHIPAASREQAATALKAARVATDESAADGERSAALGRAIKLLDALALYYLPTGLEARDAIEGRPIRQLPGRRADA